MRRRAFIRLLGSAAAAWPLAVRAQQSTMPVVGFLGIGYLAPLRPLVSAFRKGLGDAGYVEGQNVTIDYRWAEYHYERLPDLAADLARAQVAVIVATGGEVAALAAKKATTTIAIVFNSNAEPPRGRGKYPRPPALDGTWRRYAGGWSFLLFLGLLRGSASRSSGLLMPVIMPVATRV